MTTCAGSEPEALFLAEAFPTPVASKRSLHLRDRYDESDQQRGDHADEDEQISNYLSDR
jgi:hypothetical protein